jgi:hypothetical protein
MQPKAKALADLTSYKFKNLIKKISYIFVLEIKFEKGVAAPTVEKFQNRKPSPQALFIKVLDYMEKKFEKVSPQSQNSLHKNFT